MKLLIVEENIALRRLIRSLIGEIPHAINECESGAAALTLCEGVKPDWVFLDLNLAEADSFVTTRQIVKDFPSARVVIMADDDNPRMQQAAHAAGAYEYILKDDLLSLRHLLQNPTRSPKA
jgi:DNA-binding NarL/FixJ family response regulator